MNTLINSFFVCLLLVNTLYFANSVANDYLLELDTVTEFADKATDTRRAKILEYLIDGELPLVLSNLGAKTNILVTQLLPTREARKKFFEEHSRFVLINKKKPEPVKTKQEADFFRALFVSGDDAVIEAMKEILPIDSSYNAHIFQNPWRERFHSLAPDWHIDSNKRAFSLVMMPEDNERICTIYADCLLPMMVLSEEGGLKLDKLLHDFGQKNEMSPRLLQISLAKAIFTHIYPLLAIPECTIKPNVVYDFPVDLVHKSPPSVNSGDSTKNCMRSLFICWQSNL